MSHNILTFETRRTQTCVVVDAVFTGSVVEATVVLTIINVHFARRAFEAIRTLTTTK